MQVTDTVRIVRTAGLIRSALFATILSIQPPHPDDDGTNGEPTITIGYMDPDNVRLLGGPDWHKAYKRVTGVRHVSHSDVQQGKTDYCYTEVLPADGSPVHLQGLNMDIEDGPVAEAAEARSTIGTIVYINHSNDLGVIHIAENKFIVISRNGMAVHEPFTDLFSAKVYVDAQPKKETRPGEDAIKKMLAETGGALAGTTQAIGRISGSPMHLVAAQVAQGDLSKEIEVKEDAPTRTVEIGEYPPEQNITEPFSVKINGIEVERFTTREAAQEYIDKLDSNPPQMTPESIAAQNEHDRATGNVNEANQTPAEALAAEQQQDEAAQQ